MSFVNRMLNKAKSAITPASSAAEAPATAPPAPPKRGRGASSSSSAAAAAAPVVAGEVYTAPITAPPAPNRGHRSKRTASAAPANKKKSRPVEEDEDEEPLPELIERESAFGGDIRDEQDLGSEEENEPETVAAAADAVEAHVESSSAVADAPPPPPAKKRRGPARSGKKAAAAKEVVKVPKAVVQEDEEEEEEEQEAAPPAKKPRGKRASDGTVKKPRTAPKKASAQRAVVQEDGEEEQEQEAAPKKRKTISADERKRREAETKGLVKAFVIDDEDLHAAAALKVTHYEVVNTKPIASGNYVPDEVKKLCAIKKDVLPYASRVQKNQANVLDILDRVRAVGEQAAIAALTKETDKRKFDNFKTVAKNNLLKSLSEYSLMGNSFHCELYDPATQAIRSYNSARVQKYMDETPVGDVIKLVNYVLTDDTVLANLTEDEVSYVTSLRTSVPRDGDGYDISKLSNATFDAIRMRLLCDTKVTGIKQAYLANCPQEEEEHVAAVVPPPAKRSKKN